MPGVKGRSGRKQKDPLNENTPYQRRKAWAELDRQLEEIKSTDPAHYAWITSGGQNEFGNALPDEIISERRAAVNRRVGAGRSAANAHRSVNVRGVGRIRHAVSTDAEAIDLARYIVGLHNRGLSKANIAERASRKAGGRVSVKAISKLLTDIEIQEGQMQ